MKNSWNTELFQSIFFKRANHIFTNYFVLFVCGLNAIVLVVGCVLDWEDYRYVASGIIGAHFGFWLSFLALKTVFGAAIKARNHPPSLKRISNFADFWGLGLRKRIKATAGDFDAEIRRLHKEKRFRMAKWNVILAWGYAIWYVLRGPYDLVKGALVKALKGL